MEYQFITNQKTLLADTVTPVSIYLRLRDQFPNSLLLESSEYHTRDNNMSYICCQPIAGIVAEKELLKTEFPNGEKESKKISKGELRQEISDFRKKFKACDSIKNNAVLSNGLFGYFTYEAIEHFEDITLSAEVDSEREIPMMQYHIYRYVIAIDHFHNRLHIFENLLENEQSSLDEISGMIQNKNFPEYNFSITSKEESNRTDQEHKDLVEKLVGHIRQGEVFQIVPSRAFKLSFKGDEFNVYRALRSINPSPYLFYFDYGSFRLFGSSPEAQITIKNEEATIYPIAGTFKRTGDIKEDFRIAEELKKDPKERAEHVMLVDLARNDLSRHCSHVQVESYMKAQFYSHVIHLVSKVTGKLRQDVASFEVVADTFPAGTLSGAPKYRALELIDQYEGKSRSFYSGSIGFMGFQQEFNHAIMIRSFLSKQNLLHYQAGGGIVLDSDPEKELQEVNNKIAALRKAIEAAETM
ncbi:MAG TPA: anthranilate synthase component I family protein [Candidatus Sphingobacterium stercoripullorum]|uniref:Anthranilate synthase component 1 n=1 Tax=Candidatus Sphingobacterium stercoripullorum TaxID=2838759 RepID=A0A9D2AYL4_9SPHI|nr:anthranilate synthase component I family protein [Candidatus Sphingobacterium stercoripullorum]HLR50859.1 anthranilate synthase component I family protein [Candidatus Sphingobacterium stercoripullorum]